LKKLGGVDGMIGETGIVKETLNPHGRVFVHGEIWEAECQSQISEGESVIVESVEGLKVRVKKSS
jgi:membrane-bound serine protease (ClpP class)